MLKSLSIRNYALIEKLDISYSEGFSTITGETGAGKTILLGALGLLVGNRANTSVLKNKEKKCIVEAVFNIKNYGFEQIFDENDLDYEEYTIIRREISPQAKSRAFINDTPVQVALLKIIGEKLIDIHSQHQNLILNDKAFQINLVDAFAKNEKHLVKFKSKLNKYKELKKEFLDLEALSLQSQADLDYNKYLFEELDKAQLIANEQDQLEEEQNTLSNSEEIMGLLASVSSNLSLNEESILSNLSTIKRPLDSLTTLLPKTEEIAERLNSSYLELKDIADELEGLSETVEFNPERLEQINDRLNLIYQLQKKHNVNSIEELLEIQDELDKKLDSIANHDEILEQLKSKIETAEQELISISDKISKNRQAVFQKIENSITDQLRDLGMPNSKFKISHILSNEFNAWGRDKIDFKFSANKHMEVESIGKIASGGEISRLMLSLKAMVSSLIKLPTIIFDEIDTGVSGEISNKMGLIMKKMSENMQVLSITHQAQIASMGINQYKVIKLEDDNSTKSTIIKLSDQERITEIAKMLSGEEISEAAMDNAKVLLKL